MSFVDVIRRAPWADPIHRSGQDNPLWVVAWEEAVAEVVEVVEPPRHLVSLREELL